MSAFRLSAKETMQFMRKARAPVPAVERVKTERVPRMPADSHREECRCGIVMKFSWTDEAFANKFIAIWWKRHSGEGHGKVK